MRSTTLKDLFAKPDIRFVIPEYQRAYTWGERQFSQFVEDLMECGKELFSGTFPVLKKREYIIYNRRATASYHMRHLLQCTY